jgi:hypothetical protein
VVGEDWIEREETGENENVLGVGDQKEREESGEKENVLGVGRYQKERRERGVQHTDHFDLHLEHNQDMEGYYNLQ